MADAELRVSSAKLEGFPPFPTWNGTLAAPLENTRGLCSVLSAKGELVVLQIGSNTNPDVTDSWLRVLKVLPPPVDTASSFCQCWTTNGEVFATAHEHRVVLYCSDTFTMLVKLQLRYSVTSMDISTRSPAESEVLLFVGTASGCFLYNVLLESKDTHQRAPVAQTPVSSLYAGIAVCLVKISSDGRTVAIGTVDGRLFLRSMGSYTDAELANFGTMLLTRVLEAPRITSISFSACSTKIVVATRKGNVYVFIYESDTLGWKMLPSCKGLSANPKAKAIATRGTNKAATAAQTLVACWGPLFVMCSRAVASRLEIYDFASGSLLCSLQLMPAVATAEWGADHLVTGVCITQLTSLGKCTSRLLCHDTNANLTVVEWPFYDVIARRRRK